MPKSKTNYNKKEISELSKGIAEKRKQLLDSDMSLAQGKTKDVHTSRKIRIEIARIKTAMRKNELEKK